MQSPLKPIFEEEMLARMAAADEEDINDELDEESVVGISMKDDAILEVIVAKLCAIQEYGWHVGDDELKHAADVLTAEAAVFSWEELRPRLKERQPVWLKRMIVHEDDFRHDPSIRFVRHPWHWPYY